MPFRVWATTRIGWFCSQNSRICGSERMMELAAARLRLRPLASATARRSSRLARTTVSQISAPARRTPAATKAPVAIGREPGSAIGGDAARSDAGRQDEHAGKASRNESDQLTRASCRPSIGR